MTRFYPDAAYDPEPDPGNFWLSTVDRPTTIPLQGDETTEIAIVGAGITGLSAALQLVEKYGLKCTVLDAAFPGWGASGRNGGFVCFGGSKVAAKSLIKRFGEPETCRFYDYQAQAIDQVAANLQNYSIDADTHSDGEWAFAHRPSDFSELQDYAHELNHLRGLHARTYSQAELKERGMFSPEFHGGMHLPIGFAFNPIKYTLGLANAANKAGVVIYGQSPVSSINRDGNHWRLTTPQGSLTAFKVIFATNGYSSDDMPDGLNGRFLPVFSNILVTRPLTQTEQSDQGWSATNASYDTRHLLHYWRLMPDSRMLFGLRGGTGYSSTDRTSARIRARADFDRIFPAWRHVETPYFWSGLVCLTRDRLMKIGKIEGKDNMFTVIGCQGSGVTMCSLSGRRIADLAVGAIMPNALPAALGAPIQKFPFPALRRAYLKAAYAFYSWQDS